VFGDGLRSPEQIFVALYGDPPLPGPELAAAAVVGAIVEGEQRISAPAPF
jgi:hypothetical protein